MTEASHPQAANTDPHRAHIDFGRRSDDYARYRAGPPASFFDRLETHVPLAGKRAVDLGTGPGIVALLLAERGRVIGIDKSANQIAAAQRSAQERGLAEHARFLVSPAEETGLDSSACDLVTATQCWVWFDHDLALAEAKRLLRPGGLLAVIHFCYLASWSTVAAATEELVLRHNPTWTMSGFDGLYPNQIDRLSEQGMEMVEQFSYVHDQPFTHEAWRGRIRTCNGVGSGILSDEQVEAFDAELAALLDREFPEEPMLIAHRVWATIVRKPAS